LFVGESTRWQIIPPRVSLPESNAELLSSDLALLGEN